MGFKPTEDQKIKQNVTRGPTLCMKQGAAGPSLSSALQCCSSSRVPKCVLALQCFLSLLLRAGLGDCGIEILNHIPTK